LATRRSVESVNKTRRQGANNRSMDPHSRHNRRNYYRILHVQRDAPLEIIKTSYRTLMQRMKMHPDLGGDHADAQLINQAYATLSDPERRAAYDAGLEAAFDNMRGGEPETAQKPPAADSTSRTHAHAARERRSNRAEAAVPRCAFCERPVPPGAADEGMSCAGCDSPLRPVRNEPAASRFAERTIERMPQQTPALIQLRPAGSEVFAAQVVDMSPGGMRVRASVIIPIGAIIRVQSTVCRGVGRVRSCFRDPADAPHERQIGVQFSTLEFRTPTGSFVSVDA